MLAAYSSKPLSEPFSEVGSGWAWTPAANTFKAFTRDDAKGLVVIPFSGWSYKDYQYNNGVQLIEYTPTSITTLTALEAELNKIRSEGVSYDNEEIETGLRCIAALETPLCGSVRVAGRVLVVYHVPGSPLPPGPDRILGRSIDVATECQIGRAHV